MRIVADEACKYRRTSNTANGPSAAGDAGLVNANGTGSVLLNRNTGGTWFLLKRSSMENLRQDVR